MQRDSVLVAVLAVSLAGLGWTALRAFHRAPASRDYRIHTPAADALDGARRAAELSALARPAATRPPPISSSLPGARPLDEAPGMDATSPAPSNERPAAQGSLPAPPAASARNATASAAAVRLPSASPDLPSGGASAASVASRVERARTGAAAEAARAGAPPRESPPPPARPPNPADRASSATGLEAGLGTAAGGLVSQARHFKVAGTQEEAAPDFSDPANVRSAFLQQQALDERVDHSVRDALDRLDPGADIEDQRQATSDALAAAGQPHDEIAITNALARAQQPPPGSPDAPTPPAPGALDSAINSFAASYPAPNGTSFSPQAANTTSATPGAGEPKIPVGPEYVPREKPPKGARDAYKNYASAFAEALKRFGVQPWDILAICQQESGFGRNMGKTPLPQGLAKRQADMAAAIKLEANGHLPAPWQNLRGSSTGALGPFQFEPATQLWAGKGNPFDWNNQISYSVPHLLKLNGYKADDPVSQRKAFGRYYGDGNPNGKYALSVAGHAAAIKPVIEGEKP